MPSQQYKVDKKTGALIFTQSPEAKQLQGLRGDIQNLIRLVQGLTDEVQELKSQISKMGGKQE